MELKDEECQNGDFYNSDDQQSNVSTDYQKFIEVIIPSLETFIDEQDFIRKQFLLKIELLERENVQLKSSQIDKGRELCYLLRKIEINSVGNDSDFLSEDRTPDEFTSNKLAAFRNMEKLQEQNQMLWSFVREVIMLGESQYRIDTWNFVNKIADHKEKLCQRAMQLQQASDVLIETLNVENEHLRKENVTLNEIVKSATTSMSTRDASISEIQQKLQEFRKHLLTLKQDYLKDCKQNSQNMTLCAHQFNIMLEEGRKLTEINRRLTAEVKLYQENTASQLVKIQSVKKDNEDLIEEVQIQEANNSAGYLLQIEYLDKQKHHLTEEVNIGNAKIVSYFDWIQSLQKQNQSTTKHTEDLTKELNIRKAKIADYLQKIRYLEKLKQTAQHKRRLTEEFKIRETRIASYIEQIKSLEEQNETTEKQNETLTKQIAIMKQKLSEAENYVRNFNPNHRTKETVDRDENPVNAFDTKSKRPYNEEHFNETPTQNKRRKLSQHKSDDVNFIEKNFFELPTYSENGLIIRNCSHVSSHSVYPLYMIDLKNLCTAAIKCPETGPETCPESDVKSGIAIRGRETRYNLRQSLKKKVYFG